MKWAIQATVLSVWNISELNKFPNLYRHDQVNIVHFIELVPPILGKVLVTLFYYHFPKAFLGLAFDFNLKWFGLVFNLDDQGPWFTLLSTITEGKFEFWTDPGWSKQNFDPGHFEQQRLLTVISNNNPWLAKWLL